MSEEPGMCSAHAAPIQMTFYTGSQFPTQYRNDAYVAMRGHVLAEGELIGLFQAPQ